MENLSEIPAEQEVAHWTWRDVLIIAGGILFLLFGGIIGLYLLIGFSRLNFNLNSNDLVIFNLAAAALEGVAIIGSVYWFGLHRKHFSWYAAGFRPLSNTWLLISVVLGFVAIPSAGLIALGIRTLLGLPMENPQVQFLAPGGFTWIGFLGMLLLGGVIVPIAEELFFRGVLYTWLRDRWGLLVGTLGSALIFGLVHVEPSVAGAAFVLGIVLAVVYQRSQSLWSSILIHVINNSVQIIILYAFLALGKTPPV
jgi:membrane protease YdiL (CAAX protease family)